MSVRALHENYQSACLATVSVRSKSECREEGTAFTYVSLFIVCFSVIVSASHFAM